MKTGPQRRVRSAYKTLLVAALVLSGIGARCCRALSRRQAESWARQIRQALFIPNPLPPLQVRTYGTFFPAEGIAVDRVTYTTEYGMRIPALLYRPASSRKKLPGIVIVPGHGGDKSSWYVYYGAIMFAKAGAAVLTYDPIGEGERNDDHKSRTSEHDRAIEVPSVPQRLAGLMILDAMQGVSYLAQRPDVDARRIAVLGDSLGSFVTVLTGAVDPGIRAIVLTGGGNLDGPNGYWDSSHDVMCQSGPYKALRFLGDRPAVIYTLNARRGTTFIINGTGDTAVDIPHHGESFFADLRARVIAMNGSKKNVFQTYFVPDAQHRPDWLMMTAIVWLDRSLHFANWNSSQIAALPETSIRDWALKKNIPMSPRYLAQNEQGGILTLDVDVPNLTQEQLDVLPVPVWEQQRERFVYSRWAADAIADAEARSGQAH